MGTIWIQQFTGGLDSRRMPETTTGGVLIRARNGHINRGGEFEKRAAFVPEYVLPEQGTVGLAYTRIGLVVFGSGDAPVLPPAVSYQRLVHPDGNTALTRIPSFDLYAGKIYAVGEFADGSRYHYYDGVRVGAWYDGRARASFRVTAGIEGVSTLTGVEVGGITAAVGAPVTWHTSNEATAAAVADALNAFTTAPDYQATAVGDMVNLVSAEAGASYNGYTVKLYTSDGFGVSTPETTLAGGADSSGTFVPGSFVRTIGTKEYSVSGANLHFSGIDQPMKWTTDATGAGFTDMSKQVSGTEQLYAVAEYQNFIAIFAERTVLVYYVDPDPANNKRSQTLRNTGTASPRSVTQFGDNDLFYLDESGVRSLRARDASNAAATTDIGVPIDTLVSETLSSLTLSQREGIIGLIEPRDGRFWLCCQGKIYVFSFFPGAKVSAWSTYEPGFVVEDAVVFNRRVYVRSGHTIYAYGGLGSAIEYDDAEAEAWLPYLDASAPAKKKSWTGIDAALTGDWEVRVAYDPTNLAASDKVAELNATTFNEEAITGIGESTHVSLRFRSTGSGPAKIGSAVIHYLGDDNEG